MDASSLVDPPRPRATPWRWGLTLAALATLAAALGTRAAQTEGSCPLEGQGLSCAALIRPRLAWLGPLRLADLALLAGLLALATAAVFLTKGARRPFARDASLGLAALAGCALGLQALSWSAAGALCPLCLAVVAGLAASAGLAAEVAAREAGLPRRRALAVGAVTLLLVAPWGAWRGSRLHAEDAERRAAVLAAGGERGPRLLLVVRPGCPWCEALLTDVLAEPEPLALLARTRGLELLAPEDPRARGLRGVPTLLLAEPDPRAPLPPLEGLVTPAEAVEWLERAVAASGG